MLSGTELGLKITCGLYMRGLAQMSGSGEPWEPEVLSQERLEMPGMEGAGVRDSPQLPPLAGVA